MQPSTSPKITEKISVRYILNDYIRGFYRMMKLLSKYKFAKHIQRQRLSEKKDFVWKMFDLSRLNRTVSKLFGENEIHG